MCNRYFKIVFLMICCSILTSQSSQVYAKAIENDTGKTAPLNKRVPGIQLKRNLVTGQPFDFKDPVSPGIIQNFLSGLNTGGYYRGFAYSRKMTDKYGTEPKKYMNLVDVYYDPMMFLYVGGNATPNTSFGAELILANPFDVYRGAGYFNNGEVKPFNTMVLRGNFNTKIGSFNVIAGGIEWGRLTPFTFGANVGFNRYSIFERRPWDPVGNIKTRYASYYYSGNINQDMRWGTRAFKGFMVNGFNNAYNTYVDIFYGRTDANGGIDREDVVRPSSNFGARIKKNFVNNNYISLNTFNSFNRSDSINSSADVQWNIITSEFAFKYKGIILNGEVGAGRYTSPNYPEDWSPAILTDLAIPQKYTGIALNVRYYQIGKSFTSNVANFNNTTISEVNNGFAGAGTKITTPFGSTLDNVGDLANNRRGLALNTNVKVWKFVFSGGLQSSAQMEHVASDTALTFSHRINNLVWSRLPGVFPFYYTFGPHNRVGTYYRGAFEFVKLSGEAATARKYFNSMDLQMKFKTRIFNKDVYINYLGAFNSVQTEFSPISKFNNQALIRAQFHEGEMYFQLTRDLIIDFYAGLERIHGNNQTDIGPNGKPRNQTGQALGVGFDFAISNQTTLFFRQRWFSFEDKNFPGEKFNGNEATIELKIFF